LKSEEKFEQAIGFILVSGVVISLILEVIGMILFYDTYGDFRISDGKLMFVHGKNFFSFIFDLFTSGTEKPILFMTLGIGVLMVTPYMRVILSVGYFIWVRNTKYVVITLFVLTLLTLSLLAR
jgi:uncharacterized membrane protein